MKLKWHRFCASRNILNCLKLLESLQPLKKDEKADWISYQSMDNPSKDQKFLIQTWVILKCEDYNLWNFHAYPSICIKPFVCLQLNPFASMSTGKQAVRHVLRKFLSSIRTLTNLKCFSRTELIGLALTTPFLAYRFNKNHWNLWNIWQNHE